MISGMGRRGSLRSVPSWKSHTDLFSDPPTRGSAAIHSPMILNDGVRPLPSSSNFLPQSPNDGVGPPRPSPSSCSCSSSSVWSQPEHACHLPLVLCSSTPWLRGFMVSTWVQSQTHAHELSSVVVS